MCVRIDADATVANKGVRVVLLMGDRPSELKQPIAKASQQVQRSFETYTLLL